MLLVNLTSDPMFNQIYLTLEYVHLLDVIRYVGRHSKDKYEIYETYLQWENNLVLRETHVLA